ncbi:MAG: DUF1800 family protein, partial [Pseudomonadota bacterium]
MKLYQTGSVLALAAMLAACSQTGDDGGAGVDVAVGPLSRTVTGVAAAGLAECRIEATDLNGEAIADAFIGESNPVSSNGTPTDGVFSVTINEFTGPLVLNATDCTYIDEASNEVITGVSMRAVAVIGAGDGSSVDIHITPFTTLAADLAEQRAEGLANLDAARINEANDGVSMAFFGEDVDILRTRPIIATEDDPDESQEASIEYGLVLAALSGAGDVDEAVEELMSEVDIDTQTLSEEGEELLLEGAAVFEGSGYKTVEKDSFAALSREADPEQPVGSAPLISVLMEVVTITAGDAFQVDEIAYAEDADDDLKDFRFRGLPGQVIQSGDRSIAGVVTEPGQYPFMAVARDEAGNVASTRLFLNVQRAANAAPAPSDPPSDSPNTPGGGDTPEQPGSAPTPGEAPQMPPQSDPGTPPASQSYTVIASTEQAVQFLMRAGFGGTKAEADALVGTDAADWIKSQMAMTPQDIFPEVLEKKTQSLEPDVNFPDPQQPENFDQMLGGEDNLRQRMQFALSQILVASDGGVEDVTAATYRDILNEHAFGNYRDLMEDVTYSLMMGRWLTYLNNRKGDPNTGRTPDQNYAREILQLFSIGVTELDPDGQPKLDGNGELIETYDQDDITGLARVFTGFRQAQADNSINNSIRPSNYLPMRMDASRHSELDKTFLTTTIPAGTSGEASVALALDEIFSHPNVAPFICRQLIQRFTASNPEPEYVERVSTAFEEGRFVAPGGQQFGDGRRGSLEATLAAILLDETLFDGQIQPSE